MWDLFPPYYDGYDIFGGGGGGDYYGRSEKSDAARRREQVCLAKFDEARRQVESAIVTNKLIVIELGCRSKSNSGFAALPKVCLDHVLGFVFVQKKEAPPPQATPKSCTARAASKSSSRDTGNDKKCPAERDFEEPLTPAELAKAVQQPGNKIVLPLTKPNCHMTGPCWRDFSRTVRTHANWDVKRIVATLEEKKFYKETRQGKVYFINAIYTVPGGGAGAGAPTKQKKQTKQKRAQKFSTTNDGADKKKKAKTSQPEAAANEPGNTTSSSSLLLPPGWVEVTDLPSGKPYYYNAISGNSTWEKPSSEGHSKQDEE